MTTGAALVGVADMASPTGTLDGSVLELEVACIADALADAGLSVGDVDGLCVASGPGWAPAIELAEHIGLHPRWTDSTQVGGASPELHVEHAAAAVAAGLCDVVVVAFAATPRRTSAAVPAPTADPDSARTEWEAPYGVAGPLAGYALAANRHMAVFGTTSAQLASIAVSTRAWAADNPRARYREPITVEDVLASPMQADPLHRLDCCLVTDGAGAVVVTSLERARDLRSKPVEVLGAGSCVSHALISEMPDLTATPGSVSGTAAFRMAGVTPADVDVAELYDSFTITVLLALEDLGFCAKGEGGPFAASGALAPGGALPTNTNGGGLSYTHPGAYGMFLLVEAVRQLRGEAGARQVAGAEVAVAHGCGGQLSATGTVVLGAAR